MATTTTLQEAPTRAPAAEGSSSNKRWWILAILGIAQLMVVLDATIVNIALPTAQKSLGFSNDARQWIVTAYALAFGSLLLLGGRIADVFGRKWVFLIGLVGFALASAVGGAAVNVGMLITARAVQGLFAALLAPAILSLLTTTFTAPLERAKAFGIFGAIAGAGGSIGLLLGGVLTEYANWRWTLYVNLIFAAIALAGGYVLLEHSKSAHRARMDIPGTVVVSAGLFALVYGFSHAETDGWANGLTIGFLVASAVLLVAFVVIQQRIAHPLLPLRIVTDRNRGGAFLAMFASAAGMFAVFLFLTYYMQASLGYSAIQSGAGFLPMMGVLIVTSSVVSTQLVTKVSPKILIPVGMALAAVGMYLLTFIDLSSGYVGHILPGLIVMGVGLGLVFATGFGLATLGVQASDSGVASATVNTMQQVGGSVGTALMNTIAASAATSYASSHLGSGPMQLIAAKAAVHSYTVSFWWAAGIFVVGALISAMLLRPDVPQYSEDAAPAALH
jgi:EmrB/QacA subfamily drug resistance transporter